MSESVNDVVYEFGRDIIVEARDGVIDGTMKILRGEVNDSVGRKIFEKISGMDLNENDKEAIALLVLDRIDAVIQRIFINLDEQIGKYKIIAEDGDGNSFDIVGETDDLPCGYLEFVNAFSKYKSPCDIAVENVLDYDWHLYKDE